MVDAAVMDTETGTGDCLAWAARDASGTLSPYRFSRRYVWFYSFSSNRKKNTLIPFLLSIKNVNWYSCSEEQRLYTSSIHLIAFLFNGTLVSLLNNFAELLETTMFLWKLHTVEFVMLMLLGQEIILVIQSIHWCLGMFIWTCKKYLLTDKGWRWLLSNSTVKYN